MQIRALKSVQKKYKNMQKSIIKEEKSKKLIFAYLHNPCKTLNLYDFFICIVTNYKTKYILHYFLIHFYKLFGMVLYNDNQEHSSKIT